MHVQLAPNSSCFLLSSPISYLEDEIFTLRLSTSDLDTLFCLSSSVREHVKWANSKFNTDCLHFFWFVFFSKSLNVARALFILEHEPWEKADKYLMFATLDVWQERRYSWSEYRPLPLFSAELPENWTDTRETILEGMTFNLRHLGMTLVDQPKGEELSAAAVKRIVATVRDRSFTVYFISTFDCSALISCQNQQQQCKKNNPVAFKTTTLIIIIIFFLKLLSSLKFHKHTDIKAFIMSSPPSACL